MKPMTQKYAILIEPSATGYAAYVPDLPGVVATEDTIENCKKELEAAIAFYLEGMRVENLPIPEPTTIADYIAT